MTNDLYDADHCYECEGYGDDYYEDENGNWVCACDSCPFSPWVDDEEDWY